MMTLSFLHIIEITFSLHIAKENFHWILLSPIFCINFYMQLYTSFNWKLLIKSSIIIIFFYYLFFQFFFPAQTFHVIAKKKKKKKKFLQNGGRNFFFFFFFLTMIDNASEDIRRVYLAVTILSINSRQNGGCEKFRLSPQIYLI